MPMTANKNKFSHILWQCLPLVAFLVWGVFAISPNLWYDEAFSASMVSSTWYKLLYITAADDHSPFYYVLLKLFYHLCGGGDHFWSLKLMSLLFMTGYILLGKYYVKKLFSEQISIYFCIFSILMPIMSVQAGNVRMYATALFFLTLTGLTAYDIYLEGTRRKWILFTFASICTVYCHTFALIQTFLFYLLFLGVLLLSRQFQKLKPFFLSGITVAVTFSPWLLITIRQMVLRMRYDTGSVQERPTIYAFMDYCKEWFSALETPIGWVVFLEMGLAIVLGYLAVDWMRTHGNFAPAVGAGALGFTILAGVLISIFINNCFMGRYAFPGFGFLMLIYAIGLDQLASNRAKAAILAIAGLCFVLQYRSELSLEYDKGLKTYENFVEKQMTPEDAIVANDYHAIFLNVYHPELKYFIMRFKSFKMPYANTQGLMDWNQLDDVEGNIWYICFQGGSPDDMREYYNCKEALKFHYMYYDFEIWKCERKDGRNRQDDMKRSKWQTGTVK